MVPSGNLRQFPLAELLQSCSLSRKSGVLQILTRDHNYKLFIFKGVLVSVSTTEPSRKIGQFLIARGYLDEQQLRDALEEQEIRGDRRLGEILSADGLLSAELLDQAMRLRAEEIIADLFLLEEGVFHFDDRSVLPSERVELDLDLDALVLEGLRRREEWNRVHRVLTGDNVRLRARPGGDSPDGETKPFHAWLLEMLRRERPIGEVVISSRRSAYDVYLELFRLVEAGRIEIVTTRPDRTAGPVVLDLRQIEEEIRALARGRDYIRAWERIRTLQGQLSEPPWLGEIRTWLVREESEFLLQRFTDATVPGLAVDMKQVRGEELDPKEGFLLSRLGEGMNVKTLCLVMPLEKIEILRLLHSLERRGILWLDVSAPTPRRTC